MSAENWGDHAAYERRIRILTTQAAEAEKWAAAASLTIATLAARIEGLEGRIEALELLEPMVKYPSFMAEFRRQAAADATPYEPDPGDPQDTGAAPALGMY